MAKLTDNQVHDALYAAQQSLEAVEAETVRGNTALEAARRMLNLLQLGLIYAMEKNQDGVPGAPPQSNA